MNNYQLSAKEIIPLPVIVTPFLLIWIFTFSGFSYPSGKLIYRFDFLD